MPSLPVSRRRALVLAAAALALLAVAGRTLAGAGAAAEQPPQALVAEPAAARRSSSSTSRAPSGDRVCTGWPRANASPTRSPVRAERPRRPTPPRSTSRRRSPTGCRCSCRGGVAGRRSAKTRRRPRQPQLRDGGRARRASRDRAGDRPEDRRLPRRARRLPLGRRSRCDPGHRAGARRAAAGPRLARDRARLADAARRSRRCVGLALANAIARRRRRRALRRRGRSPSRPRRCRARGCPPARSRSRSPAGGGGACGSTRSTRACSRPRSARAGARSPSSPARRARSPFALRVPAEVRPLRRAPAPRAGAARAAARPLAAAGRRPRAAGDGRRAARSGGRLRRARLAARRGVHVVLHGGDWRIVGRRGGIGGVSDRLRAQSRARSRPGSRASAAPCSPGSCSARTRGSRTSCATTSRPPGSTTCWPSRGRTSRSSRSACSGWPGCSGSPGCAAEVGGDRGDRRVRPRGRLAAVGRARRRRGRAGVARLAALPAARPLALPRARARSCCSRGRRRRLLEPGFQLSFAAVGAIFLVVPRLRRALEGYPLPRLAPRRARRLDRVRRGDRADPLAPVRHASRSTRCSANALVALAIGPLLGLALVGSLVEPVLPRAALALAWLDGWLAAYIAAVRELVGGLPFAQIGSRDAVCAAARSAGRAARCSRRLPRVAAAGWRSRVAAIARAPRSLAWQLLPAARLPPPTGLRDHVPRRRPGRLDAARRLPRARSSSTRARPRRTSRASCAALGVRRLAAIVLTHPQRDHVGGAEDVIRRLAVDRVLDPGLARSGPDERGARWPTAAQHGVAVVRAGRRRLPARAGCGCACSGPTAPGRRARTRTSTRSCSLATLRRGRRAADRRRRDGRDGAAPARRRSRS